MARGFLYLVAIIDWFSRAVLAWRLSNTMDATFCVEALEAALARFGKPEIFNSDPGAQFTGATFPTRLEAAGIVISMYGRGRWLGTQRYKSDTVRADVFTEREDFMDKKYEQFPP